MILLRFRPTLTGESESSSLYHPSRRSQSLSSPKPLIYNHLETGLMSYETSKRDLPLFPGEDILDEYATEVNLY